MALALRRNMMERVRRNPEPFRSRPFCNILCPIDFSDQSRMALRIPYELASGPPARVTVLSVHDPTIVGVEAIAFQVASRANLRTEVKDFAAKVMFPVSRQRHDMSSGWAIPRARFCERRRDCDPI